MEQKNNGKEAHDNNKVKNLIVATIRRWKIEKRMGHIHGVKNWKQDVEQQKRIIERAKEDLKNIKARKPKKLVLTKDAYESYILDMIVDARKEGLNIKLRDKNFWAKDEEYQDFDEKAFFEKRRKEGDLQFINTAKGKAKLVKVEVEDGEGRWNDNYYTRDGFFVLHEGNRHLIYQVVAEGLI